VAPSARDGSKLGARRMRLGSGNRTPPTLGNVSRSSAETTLRATTSTQGSSSGYSQPDDGTRVGRKKVAARPVKYSKPVKARSGKSNPESSVFMLHCIDDSFTECLLLFPECPIMRLKFRDASATKAPIS